MTALATVHARADQWWLSTAETALAELIRRGLPFTTDSLRDLGVPDTEAPRWGSFMAAAKARGDIIPVGFAVSRRPSRNCGYTRLWQGIPRAA